MKATIKTNQVKVNRSPKKKSATGKLIKYVFCHYKAASIAVIILIIASAIASVTATMFMQRLIDDCIVPGISGGLSSVWARLLLYIALMGGIYLLGVAAAFVYTRLAAIVTQGTLMHLRKDMFSRMNSLPVRYFDTHAHGDIMSTYTNDTDAIRQLIGQSIPTLIQGTISIVSIFTAMLSYSLYLTAVVVLSCVVMALVTKKLGGKSAKYMLHQQKSLAAEEGYLEEMMNGQKVVKVFGYEAESKQRFADLNEKLFQDSERANRYGNVLMPVLGNIGNLLYVFIALVGGILIAVQAANVSVLGFHPLTVGVIVSFLAMSRQLSQTVNQTASQVTMVAMGAAGANRVFELLSEKPETDEGYVTLVKARRDESGQLVETDENTGLWAWKHPHRDGGTTYAELKGWVELNGVDFAYESGKTVLHDVTLQALPGQKIAFVGATGAGKTTITNLINRFYDIEDGKVRYDGININKIKKPDLRRSLGVVLQDVNLFSGTVLDNIRYGKLDATDEECIAAAKLANADSFITRLSLGYNTVLSNNGSNFSQGQRQLLSIARAAVANTPVMILDEATSSIDTRTEALVQDGMDKLMRGRTVFVIAHRLSTVRNSDKIVVLDHGKIIESGTHDGLIAQKGAYYQLYTGAFELE